MNTKKRNPFRNLSKAEKARIEAAHQARVSAVDGNRAAALLRQDTVSDDKPSHTPGPWTVDDANKVWGVSDCADGSDCQMCRPAVASTLSDDFEEQDARLIAAAPDLLAALKECEKAIKNSNACSLVGDAARAAILRATESK